MLSTTLCYIERDGCFLMLHRNRKEHDLNEGKWIGVGGKLEPGETPLACVIRETKEETGLDLGDCRLRGVVEFVSERWEDEHMYLYTSDSFEGELAECDEGELEWIPKKDVFSLPLWEGDRAFLSYLLADEPFFHLEVRYGREDELLGTALLPNIILASASPRRLELLRQIGIDPIVLPSTVSERMDGVTPEEIVKGLSRQKAEDVASGFSHGELVIGADTVVAVGNRILGKPGTHEEAADMIRLLAGRTHQVYTGVTLIRCGNGSGHGNGDGSGLGSRFGNGDGNGNGSRFGNGNGSGHAQIRTFAAKTDVRVSPMTEAEILCYAESDEPMDKAGAYGIQGSFGAFVEGIDVEYANVVGLPIARLYRELKEMELKEGARDEGTGSLLFTQREFAVCGGICR